MPYIIKNGKTYTGNSVSLTQAQYDALSEVEKNNGVAYYIYDSDTVLDASDVGLGTGSVETLAGSVAVIETSPATTTHAVGDYIVYNGQLYKVISYIRTGATLTPDTNISAVSVGAELTSLNNGLVKRVQLTGTTTTQGLYTTTYPFNRVIAASAVTGNSVFLAIRESNAHYAVIMAFRKASSGNTLEIVPETEITFDLIYV